MIQETHCMFCNKICQWREVHGIMLHCYCPDCKCVTWHDLVKECPQSLAMKLCPFITEVRVAMYSLCQRQPTEKNLKLKSAIDNVNKTLYAIAYRDVQPVYARAWEVWVP